MFVRRLEDITAAKTQHYTMMNQLLQVLPPFSAFLKVKRVILFGSRARGDYEERSDIDLAVDAPDMNVLDWDSLCDYMQEHSATLLPVELLWFQHVTTSLRDSIEAEGVILFEREDGSIH